MPGDGIGTRTGTTPSHRTCAPSIAPTRAFRAPLSPPFAKPRSRTRHRHNRTRVPGDGIGTHTGTTPSHRTCTPSIAPTRTFRAPLSPPLPNRAVAPVVATAAPHTRARRRHRNPHGNHTVSPNMHAVNRAHSHVSRAALAAVAKPRSRTHHRHSRATHTPVPGDGIGTRTGTAPSRRTCAPSIAPTRAFRTPLSPSLPSRAVAPVISTAARGRAPASRKLCANRKGDTPSLPTLVPVRGTHKSRGDCSPRLLIGNVKQRLLSYFTIPATSAAKSSSRFWMPSPFSKRVYSTSLSEPPAFFAHSSMYCATDRLPSFTNACWSRQFSS